MTSPEVQFYALLFVPSDESTRDVPNIDPAISPDRRRVDYLAMALRLANGVLRHHGRRLTLLTNRSTELKALIARDGRLQKSSPALEIVDIAFGGRLPEGARHFSASHKLYAFRHFSEQDQFSILLDLDMICQTAFSADMQARILRQRPLVYDISDQVFPAFTYDTIAEELRLMSSTGTEHRWFGGEFIGGPGAFFDDLFSRVQAPIETYRTNWRKISRQGEEIILSSALNGMRQEKGVEYLCDIAPLNVVRRHWGIPTMHDAQRFGRTDDVSFIHLPAMKALLAGRWEDRRVLSAVRLLDRLPPRLSLRARSLLFRLT